MNPVVAPTLSSELNKPAPRFKDPEKRRSHFRHVASLALRHFIHALLSACRRHRACYDRTKQSRPTEHLLQNNSRPKAHRITASTDVDGLLTLCMIGARHAVVPRFFVQPPFCTSLVLLVSKVNESRRVDKSLGMSLLSNVNSD